MSVKKAVGITLLAMGLLWAISIPGFATETLATDKVKEGFSAVEKNDSVTGLPMGDELKVAMGSKALKAYQTCYVMMRLAEKQLISDFDSETFRLSCFAYLTVDNTFQENHQHEADSKKTPVSSGKTKDDASVPSNKLSMGQQLKAFYGKYGMASPAIDQMGHLVWRKRDCCNDGVDKKVESHRAASDPELNDLGENHVMRWTRVLVQKVERLKAAALLDPTQKNVQAYAGYLGGLDEKMVDFTKPWISPPTYRF